jgi:hypothetical protein
MLGGAALRAKEKVMASPVVPKRYRSQYIEYTWTDGHGGIWYSGYDVPPDAGPVTMNINWPDGGERHYPDYKAPTQN